ncbi:Protein RnfH [uncultured Gammaproteobacteria bacterium]
MKVDIVYAKPHRQTALTVEVAEGTTIQQAIEQSGILKLCRDIDLTKQKVGIFSKILALTTPVEDGARVEIYRAVSANPTAVKFRPGPKQVS